MAYEGIFFFFLFFFDDLKKKWYRTGWGLVLGMVYYYVCYCMRRWLKAFKALTHKSYHTHTHTHTMLSVGIGFFGFMARKQHRLLV